MKTFKVEALITHWIDQTRALSFKEISLNWRNLDLFKEDFKEIGFLGIF